ncbi:hypothetical protein PBY51_017032 [Eleginops maclovinus]|uniref:Uncharacterized protein n=1 Tax=Eleginops maclovinus TaxID=56733 RepID=A0AAN7WSU6_ELEMC|nr:hypothetical protein PBY51_017032 [Eleginops maclovinus]
MSLCTDAPTDLFIRIKRQWTKQTAKTAARSSQIRGREETQPKGSSKKMFTANFDFHVIAVSFHTDLLCRFLK